MSASFEKPEPRKVTIRDEQTTIKCDHCKQELPLNHFKELFGNFLPTYFKTCKSCYHNIKNEARERYNWERLALDEREAVNPIWHIVGEVI